MMQVVEIRNEQHLYHFLMTASISIVQFSFLINEISYIKFYTLSSLSNILFKTKNLSKLNNLDLN